VALVEAKAPPPAPQLPAALERCLKASLRAKKQAKAKPASQAAQKAKGEAKQEVAQDQPPSADALVLKKLDAEKKRQACAAALLKWHEEQRAKAPPAAPRPSA
jgi:hypothetical protein